MKERKFSNWAELPPELIYLILLRLSVADRLGNARNVCRSWRRVSQDPSMWQKLDMRDMVKLEESMYNCYLAEDMCRRAVDLSQGGLLEISIDEFGTDSLLDYIADRSRNLKHLGLSKCDLITGVGLLQAVMKLPLLEYLELSKFRYIKLDLKAVGLSCPHLKTLKLNNVDYCLKGDECDEDAFAIAETMPGLRRLQLIGNRLSNTGLNAILENCPHLERLNLPSCVYVNVFPDLQKLC